MKKGFFLKIRSHLFLFCSGALVVSFAYSYEMKAINFVQKDEMSELEFVFDSDKIEASKFQVKEDKQIIVDLLNVTATERVMRAFDASEFSGGVVFVKTYKKPKSDNDLRVAIQLRDNVRSVLLRKPNKVVLQIENRYGVFSNKKIEEETSVKEKALSFTKEEVEKFNIPASDSVEDILENLTMSGRKKYIGKKLTMNLKNIRPEEMLRIIADTSGFNIIINEDIKKLPAVSLNLSEIPWDQALDTILSMNKLVAKKNGMILLVNTLENATKEQAESKKAKLAALEQEPLVTKIFPISFAYLKELEAILRPYLTENRGTLSLDFRTNTLIVKDTTETMEKIKKIIELLDTQTPQVLIESKVVEVEERYAKEIGLKNGLRFGYDPFTTTSPGTAPANGAFSFSTAPTESDSGIFGIAVSTFKGLRNLDFRLSLMESEQKAKIITSPKVITKNNVKAEIFQNEQRYFKTTAATTDGSLGTTTWNTQDVNITLAVTPQVTNDGSISMLVSLQKDSAGKAPDAFSPSSITKRRVTTEVLTDNGSTVVVGGIYSYQVSESHSGIPFLKDIPFLGWLFRSPYNPETTKKELIIFLTPRIINQKEAGFVDQG